LEHGKRHRKPVVRKDTDMTQTTEHKKITPGDEEFWSERGIDFHVRLARPYVRYYPDDPTPVQDAYATLRTVGQKATMSRHARQAAGILINRHAALPGLDPVPAEMRPDTAIRTGRMTRHWHGYSDPPRQFLEEACERDENGHVGKKELYDAYAKWCKYYGFKPKAVTQIREDWLRLGLKEGASKGKKHYKGVKLLDETFDSWGR